MNINASSGFPSFCLVVAFFFTLVLVENVRIISGVMKRGNQSIITAIFHL